LLGASDIVHSTLLEDLLEEASEITAMVVASIKTSRERN
jgi:hypothetical protein